MKIILTVGLLCAALLVAAVSTVNAEALLNGASETVTPITLVGE